MQDAGINAALVFALEFSEKNGKITNADLVKTLQPHKNLYAIGTANPDNLKEKLPELEVWLNSGELRGLKFYLGYEYFYPNDEKLYPIYDLCSELGRPVIYHTGFFWDPDGKGLIKYAHPLAIDDVATKFPNLKIIIAHMGNPWITDCAVVAQKNENVYIDVSGYFMEFQKISEEETKYFIDDVKLFQKLIGSYRKLLYATDWPLYKMSEYLEAAKRLSIPDNEKDSFFWKNAAELFDIKIQSI